MQPEAQNGHAHAEKKRQKPDDDISESAAAIHAGRRFKAGLTAIAPFQRWLERMGFVEDGKLTARAGDGSALL